MRLISQGNGEYVSEDVRVKVIRDDTFESECDAPHPVRLRVDHLDRWFTDRAEAIEIHKRRHGAVLKTKWSKSEKKHVEYLTWQCPGMEYHYYSQWTSSVDGEWTEIVTDSFEMTIGELEKLLGEEIKVVKKKRVTMEAQHGATISTTVPEDISERSLEAIQALGDAAERVMITDELRAINEALVRYDELMASDDAEFVDQKLHEWHLARKAELEGILAA